MFKSVDRVLNMIATGDLVQVGVAKDGSPLLEQRYIQLPLDYNLPSEQMLWGWTLFQVTIPR